MNAPLRVLIVDDEAHARINLRLVLAALPGWENAGECASADAARAVIAGGQPVLRAADGCEQAHHSAVGGVDVVLLDVQMPGGSGLELARELSRMPAPPLVVFATAHRGHAVEAFDVHALDYIVKPVSEVRLQQALERARAMLDQRAAHAQALRAYLAPDPGYWRELSVRSVGRIDRVNLADVHWLESAGNYVELHLEERTLLHRSTLSELERYLDPAAFLRIHRRIVVRRGQMAALRLTPERGHFLALHCGQELPVSERYAAAVKTALHAAGRH